ncbi:hypothetical protein LTS08_002963 [Lithohypha guttulata]|uniref:Uncharacterized protein n=1 Tax=Lithohypha guttulata TaxID=1690604 RepID=A0AAN7SZE1_9EURO|nr:hypothetical protein LTR51_000382 [Lithohypha guttulata]KAK5085572.1 hypothetical protein LTR05_004858 [Lithohypha guttulata]KAK5103546.1 hypothetical protein LTS08_002963 [Lithohypha guttulata]
MGLASKLAAAQGGQPPYPGGPGAGGPPSGQPPQGYVSLIVHVIRSNFFAKHSLSPGSNNIKHITQAKAHHKVLVEEDHPL